MTDELTIVVPVYNEGAGFSTLWSALVENIRSPFRALVVYDFDEDDTVPAARAIVERGETRLCLLKNEIRPGVVGAILTGFRQVRRGPVLVVMADLSDDLSQVDRMLEVYSQGFPLVAGSRYMKDGRLEGGPFFKQALSRAAGLSLYWLRGLPTHDATNAFKIYDSTMLKAFSIKSCHGFELNLELTVKAFLAGYRIAEVPTVWRRRTSGESHFRLWNWLPHYLKWYLYAFRRKRRLAET
jgi:glycosyltransferase involved in cell wall biosynthesis